MKKRVLLFFFILCAATLLKAQILEPVTWKITSSEMDDKGKITVTYKAVMEKGWHIYGTSLPEDGPLPTVFVFEELRNAEAIGQPVSKSKLEKKYEPMFDMVLSWYENTAVFTQEIRITNKKEDYLIKGYVEYMACNDETCLPPTQNPFTIGKAETPATVAISGTENQGLFSFEPVKIQENVDFWEPVIEELNAFSSTDTHNEGDPFWLIFLKGLMYGLIAVITPCIWPIIPMTISFFLKRGNDPKKGKKAALTYGFSIVFIYVGIGLVITALFGASALNALSTNAVFNVLIFALLVLFAISFFGGFDIALPATWSSKLENKADKASGLFSILLMAATLAIVSFSCTGPLIGTMLVHVSGGSIMAPAIGMLGFAIALAGPFTLFAFFPSWLHNLPRSGGWLNSVKVVLGFLELAFALKFLSVADLAYGWHILDREVFLVLWIVIFFLLGLYFLGKIHFRGDDRIETVSVPRLFMAIVTFAFTVYLIPGLFGAPLKSVSAFAPPVFTQDFNLHNNQVHAKFDNFDEAMEYAAKNNKPVVVDFSGFGCVNCRKMEATVWNDPVVSNLLTEKYVLVTLFVDDRKPLKEPFVVIENEKEKAIKTVGEKWSYLQRSKFGANAQPFYVLLDNEGNVLNHSFAFSENAREFASFLETGLKNFNK